MSSEDDVAGDCASSATSASGAWSVSCNVSDTSSPLQHRPRSAALPILLLSPGTVRYQTGNLGARLAVGRRAVLFLRSAGGAVAARRVVLRSGVGHGGPDGLARIAGLLPFRVRLAVARRLGVLETFRHRVLDHVRHGVLDLGLVDGTLPRRHGLLTDSRLLTDLRGQRLAGLDR